MSDELAGQGREPSTIQWPFYDLDDAIGVITQMHERGARRYDRDQLASLLGQVPKSGSFGAKISSVRMFGLLEHAGGRYQISELGYEALDASRSAAAKARAFLTVPLFNQLYEEHKGRQLPPKGAAQENLLVNMGVTPGQKSRARRVFEDSARAAGFFNSSEDRLVMPLATSTATIHVNGEPTEVQIVPLTTSAAAPVSAPTTKGDPVSVLVSIIDMATMNEDEQQAVWTLIRYLKRREAEL